MKQWNAHPYFKNQKYARTQLGLERVAIVDTDYHPGDGTQSVFYDDPSVLCISIHVATRTREPHLIDAMDRAPHTEVVWPQSANKCYTWSGGQGAGSGYNVNIPWPSEYVDGGDYEEAFETIVLPMLRSFRPQLILWACGFDAVEGDAPGLFAIVLWVLVTAGCCYCCHLCS